MVSNLLFSHFSRSTFSRDNADYLIAAIKELVTDANFDCSDEGIVRVFSHSSKFSIPVNSGVTCAE